MAAPLPKEDRAKIVEYLEQLDLSELTGVEIRRLVEEDLGISISQPTASKLKWELLEDTPDDTEFIEDDAETELTKPDKIRLLSLEQMNAIDHLLQGQSDRAVAKAVGVSRQTVWEWRNRDPLFIAELNRQRLELWSEACERLKSLANRALDVLEEHLDSGDPKIALAAAKYVLQGTKLLGETNLRVEGPTTPEDVILGKLRREAREELTPKISRGNHLLDLNPFGNDMIEKEIEALAQRKLKKAMADIGLA
jgi:transcriptional regulator with XRE-family HTH domain